MSILTKELLQDLDRLYTLRDEVRVQLHLCNQDGKEKWAALERELDRIRDNAARSTKHSLTELSQALRDFKHHLETRRD